MLFSGVIVADNLKMKGDEEGLADALRDAVNTPIQRFIRKLRSLFSPSFGR